MHYQWCKRCVDRAESVNWHHTVFSSKYKRHLNKKLNRLVPPYYFILIFEQAASPCADTSWKHLKLIGSFCPYCLLTNQNSFLQLFALLVVYRYLYCCIKITDLETIINWIAHPFELSELILKPEYLWVTDFQTCQNHDKPNCWASKIALQSSNCLGLCSWKDKASHISSNKF